VKLDDGVEKFTAETSKEFAHSLITQNELDILEKTQNYDFSFTY